MAEGVNKVLLIGNLGQTPELRQTGNGKSVMSMRLATNERYKNNEGEWTDRTEWHSVVVWGKRAEGLAKVVTKGTHLYIEGKLQTRNWEDKEGNKRFTTEVVATLLLLLGAKQNGSGNRSDNAPPPGDDHGDGYLSDEEIPF